MCVLFYASFVCISAYANVYLKTTIIKQNIQIILIAGVPSSQALPDFLITAPPSVCVPDVISVLAVCISNQNKKMIGCNIGGGGRNFSKVKRLAAKWIGTRKQLLSDFWPVQVGF